MEEGGREKEEADKLIKGERRLDGKKVRLGSYD